jgi:hypothetical protein
VETSTSISTLGKGRREEFRFSVVVGDGRGLGARVHRVKRGGVEEGGTWDEGSIEDVGGHFALSLGALTLGIGTA